MILMTVSIMRWAKMENGMNPSTKTTLGSTTTRQAKARKEKARDRIPRAKALLPEALLPKGMASSLTGNSVQSVVPSFTTVHNVP